MEPSEFVITLLIADLASVPMQDMGLPLLNGIIPILTIIVIEIVLSTLSYYLISFRKLLCGTPVILMQDGEILQKNLRQTRITPDELTELLREKDILDLSLVRYAILETNGQVSAFLYGSEQTVTAKDLNISSSELNLPITIISGGKLLRHNLSILGKDENWLKSVLKQHHCIPKDVFLLTIDHTGGIYLSLKDIPS